MAAREGYEMKRIGYTIPIGIMIAGSTNAEPRLVCDMTEPSPTKLCADHYEGYPDLIVACIKEEIAAIKFIKENSHKLPDSDVEDCALAGCKAGYSKASTTAQCIDALLSAK